MNTSSDRPRAADRLGSPACSPSSRTCSASPPTTAWSWSASTAAGRVQVAFRYDLPDPPDADRRPTSPRTPSASWPASS